MPAACCGSAGLDSRGGQPAHHPDQIRDADAEHQEIHHGEHGERGGDRRRGERRERVRGEQLPVHGVGLASHLGGDPTGDDGDEAGGAHEQRRPVQRGPLVEPAASSRDQAPEAEGEHREPQADHDAKRPEHDGDRRPAIASENP